jgi:hypothetical protein
MSITLRRKMFKLGGETNTHGIGITSGLEYRRPGYNAGGQVVKPGPDGKLRQHAVLGGIMALGRAAQAAMKLKNPLTPLAKYISGGSKLTARPTKEMIAKMKPDEIKRVLGDYGFGPGGRFSQAGRLSNLIGLGSIPGAGASLLAGPRMTPDERKTATDFQKGLDTTRGVVESLPAFSGLGFGAEVAGNIGDALYESTKQDPNYSIQTLPGLLRKMTGSSTPTEETVGSDNETDGGLNQKDISPAMETAQTQEEQFAKMKADADARAEMYYAMLGGDGPNKVRALADAFTTAGALYDEDKSQALAGFSQGIQGELDRDETVRDEARRLGLQEVVGLRDEERMDTKSRAQMVEQAKLAIMTSADMTPEQRQSTLRGLEAFELGVVDLLPTNDKGDEIDTGGMSPGSIYLDVNGITDGKYVAVSNDSNDPNQVDSFNNISEAEAHARS